MLVNTSHYPLNYPRKPLYQKILTATRTQLKRDDCAVVSNFLSPLGLSQLLAEAEERRKFAYFSDKTNTNVYFSADNASLSPNLRNANDECYEDVWAVIQGNTQKITRLNLTPGDLQLFLGRFPLHRVTQNTGPSDRLLLIMSFTEKPRMISSVERTQELYGKVTEQHLMGRERRVRAVS